MIYIIADDLTGAAEIAGICVRYGLRTSFSLDEVKSLDTYDAQVIATETRQHSLSAARKTISQLCEKRYYKAAVTATVSFFPPIPVEAV